MFINYVSKVTLHDEEYVGALVEICERRMAKALFSHQSLARSCHQRETVEHDCTASLATTVQSVSTSEIFQNLFTIFHNSTPVVTATHSATLRAPALADRF